MPIVEFAAHLRRHIDCPPQAVAQLDLQGALEQALCAAPGLRTYVLDDQDALRAHVALFINGERIARQVPLPQVLAQHDQMSIATGI